MLCSLCCERRWAKLPFLKLNLVKIGGFYVSLQNVQEQCHSPSFSKNPYGVMQSNVIWVSWLEVRHGLIQNVETVVGLLCRVVDAALLTIVCNIILDMLRSQCCGRRWAKLPFLNLNLVEIGGFFSLFRLGHWRCSLGTWICLWLPNSSYFHRCLKKLQNSAHAKFKPKCCTREV